MTISGFMPPGLLKTLNTRICQCDPVILTPQAAFDCQRDNIIIFDNQYIRLVHFSPVF